MKTTSYRSTYTARWPRPSQFKNLFNEHSPYWSKFLFKVFFWIKTGEVEVNCYWKMYNRYSYAYKPCYCPGRIYIELGPWHFGIFAIFSCQIQVKTKKNLTVWARGPWHCSICQIRPWLLHYVHKKVRWVPQLVTFKIKPLNFTWVIRLNWLANINLKEPGPSEQYYCWGPI